MQSSSRSNPCDTCSAPGHCCRAVILGDGQFARKAQTLEEAQACIDQLNEGERLDLEEGRPTANGYLPFHPLFKRQTDDAWVWWCPNLNPRTGRCDDYENRPYCCSDYKPGSDRNCILHEDACRKMHAD